MASLPKLVIGKDSWGRPRRVLNEVGNTYSRLSVLCLSRNYIKRGGKNAKWVCSCTCGGWIVVTGPQLHKGKVVSCGCKRREGSHRLPEGVASFRRALGRVKDGATKRGLKWGLTTQQAKDMMQSACHYCGCLPSNVSRGRVGDFWWNGIDQKVPCGGYVHSNCVPCCIKCNRMKMATPYAEFISRCVAIASNVGAVKQSESMKKGR